MKLRYVFDTALTLTLLVGLASASLRGNGGKATFTASGPAGLEIVGKTSAITASETDQEIRVKVALANLDTGIGLRNKHMREKYLEVSKYPTADLSVARKELKFPEEGKEVTGAAEGALKIHGKVQKVQFKYRAKKNHDEIDVNGTTRIDIRNFGINVPSYLGVTVKPNVDIAVHFVARDN